MEKTSRRSFLKACGILGLGAAATAVPFRAEAAGMPRKAHKVSNTRILMGTLVSITAINTSKARAEQAIGKAFEEMERLCGVFDRFKADTALSVLNSEGRLSGAPAELTDLTARAARFHSLSGGTFDATVKPVVDLMQANADVSGELHLSKAELDEALSLVDGSAVHVSGDAIRFGRSGMGMTLDGMAKGYIVDRASEVLAENGVDSHLINAGGDIRCRGSRVDGTAWSVAVQDPAKKGAYPDVIRMTDGALATSGGYEVYFDREKLHHHIIKPGTGLSPVRAASVSVKAPTVMQADAMATAAFVMDPKQAVRFVDSLPSHETLVVMAHGAQLHSRHWG